MDQRQHSRIDQAQRRVYLSPIFKWFPRDFQRSGGVLGFVALHTSETQRRWIERYGAWEETVWLDYDWSLNDLAGSGAAPNS